MSGETGEGRANSSSRRQPVDWVRFGLSADQGQGDSDVQFASKPSVLDETSYGGQASRANELFTEEQVCEWIFKH